MHVCVGIYPIASLIIVLAWLKEEFSDKDKDRQFGGLTTCRFVTDKISLTSMAFLPVLVASEQK